MTVINKTKQGKKPDELFVFTNGVIEDARLARQEAAVQKAWLRGLADLGLFNPEEVKAISACLDEAVGMIEAKTFTWDIRDEDIHMHLERFVTERFGEAGKKMHMGRSRNDLIATTLRLFTRDICNDAAEKTELLVDALVQKAEETIDIIVPGLTHLQHGQPVRMGHVFLSYAEGFTRDVKRLRRAADDAMESSPLGAAALAGTPLKLDLQKIAKELGFERACRNSYDAVGDRDFMLEALDAFALLGVHLGRISEDMVYAVATPVKLLTLSPDWATGSSIMPQKLNPDVPELTRGRSAHLIGAQTNGHALVRTVPTSYGSDLHELKKVVMHSYDDAAACLAVWPHFILGLKPNIKRANELLNQGNILSTEQADRLTEKGAPFREAYDATKDLVAEADKLGIQIHELPIEKLGGEPLTFEGAVERRTQSGGTAKANVVAEIQRLRKRKSKANTIT